MNTSSLDFARLLVEQHRADLVRDAERSRTAAAARMARRRRAGAAGVAHRRAWLPRRLVRPAGGVGA